jgi:hypothetical protein
MAKVADAILMACELRLLQAIAPLSSPDLLNSLLITSLQI